jgi:hypothetical protein
MLTLAIYFTLALLVGSLAVMLVFGLRNLGRSGENKLILLAFAAPLVLAGILMAVYGDWVPALIMTAVVLMALSFLLLLVSAAQRLIR